MLAKKAKEVLEARKAEKVMVLDMRGLSSVTDYYLIATGLNVPHLQALVQELDAKLRPEGAKSCRVSGVPESEWIVADYIDVVVHLFTPRTREFYELERLWCDAKRVT